MRVNAPLGKHSPWPTSSGNVVFLLDVHNSLEQQLLEQWIEQHQPAGMAAPQTVRLLLSRDYQEVDATPLAPLLDLPRETQLAPLRIAWLPTQEAISSGPRLRDLVFGDQRRPKVRRGRHIIRKSPERVHFVVGAPGSLARLQSDFSSHHRHEEGDQEQALARFIARQAALALDIAERRLQGSRYKVPRYVAESLRHSKPYLASLDELAATGGKSRPELMDEANEYMKEMISTPTTFWLDVWAKFNHFVMGLGYEDRVVCDPESLTRLRTIVREYPSALLFTHKTYLDGMVLPKVLHDNDFPMAHMFGGANMSFAGIGFLLKRAGGIFIRRSFQDNELYKITLRHYIGLLMEKRFPMTWAFEGTRSRLGKLMPPRYGLLKYVLEACNATDARNIHIIPVSISYDLIRDVEEYATEQTGRGKGPESLSWFVAYVRSLARPMGKTYMDIGEPVVLETAPDPEDRLALSKIAFEVAVQANRVTPITFPSLVTMSLLGAAPRALTEDEVVADLRALLNFAEQRGLHISKDFDRAYADQMDGLLGIMISENVVTRYDQGPEVVYGVAPEQHPVASYYRNTVIHFFVNKAIAELALEKACQVEGEEAVEVFWGEIDTLRDMFKFEFFYSPTEEFHQEIREELARYSDDWNMLLSEGAAGFHKLLNNMRPLVAHSTLLTYVEAYLVVADMLVRLPPSAGLQQSDCVSQALTFGHQLYLQRRISSEASIGKLLFQNAHQMMQHRGLTEADHENTEQERNAMAAYLRELSQRIERIKGLAITGRHKE